METGYNKMVKNKSLRNQRLIFVLVIPLGFEPKTHSLEGCCSIQLSYETRSFASRARMMV